MAVPRGADRSRDDDTEDPRCDKRPALHEYRERRAGPEMPTRSAQPPSTTMKHEGSVTRRLVENSSQQLRILAA